MNRTDTGGPAFPVPDINARAVAEGMTLRDYFATAAMQSLITGRSSSLIASNITLAYRIADAMLHARAL